MNTNIADNIRRFKDGSIDYDHYTRLCRSARSYELKTIILQIKKLSWNGIMGMLPFITAITLLNFVF